MNEVLQSLEDVTGAEFRMFMDFLKSLSLFGEKAPTERMKELIGIIEGQADLDAQFNVSVFCSSWFTECVFESYSNNLYYALLIF